VEGKKQTPDNKGAVATQPHHEQLQQPAVTSKVETTTDQITWTRDLSIDRANSSPKNSLYVKVNFEHAQGKGTANALVDSGATKNFIDIRTAERWGLPQKTLPNPRPIVNVDGTENKAGAVTKACILNVQYQKGQQLQRFYITDLGFDQVLLGYPWLHEFNPHINWKDGEVQEEVTFRTTTSAWEKWRELRRTALFAQVQVDSVTVDETVIRRDMYVLQEPELTMIEEQCNAEWGAVVLRTNFAQDWAREANEAKQALVLTVRVPDEYHRHNLVFSEEAAKRFPPS
jgi:gag-polyprotein putative aspartyl protease